MKLHKTLTLAFLLSLFAFVNSAFAGVNDNGWLIGISTTKSFSSTFRDTYIEEDLEASGLKLIFDYQKSGFNSNHRNGIEIASTEYKLKNYASEKVTTSSINYVYKSVSTNEKFNLYGGFKAGVHNI